MRNELGQFNGHQGPGRPKGAPNKRTILKQAVAAAFGGELEFWQHIAGMAAAGDAGAARLIAERLIPSLKAVVEPIEFDLNSASDMTDLARQVLAAVAAGVVPADVGSTLIQAVSSLAKIQEVDELDKRLTELEAAAHDPI